VRITDVGYQPVSEEVVNLVTNTPVDLQPAYVPSRIYADTPPVMASAPVYSAPVDLQPAYVPSRIYADTPPVMASAPVYSGSEQVSLGGATGRLVGPPVVNPPVVNPPVVNPPVVNPPAASSAPTATGWTQNGNIISRVVVNAQGKAETQTLDLSDPNVARVWNGNKVGVGAGNRMLTPAEMSAVADATYQQVPNVTRSATNTSGTNTSGAGATTGLDSATGAENLLAGQGYNEWAKALEALILRTGQLHSFDGIDGKGMPIFTPLTNPDGTPKMSVQYQLTEAQIKKYASDTTYNNTLANKAIFDANLSRQQALATMIANPTTYVAGASLANLMGARMGSTPVIDRPTYVLPSSVASGQAATTGQAGAGATSQSSDASTAGFAGGVPATMPGVPTGADAMSGRSAVTLDVSPSLLASLAGTRVSASGNPTGIYGQRMSLPDATPLSGDFGKIGIADWRRMNDTTQKQYASLAMANQPGLSPDDLTKRIAAQAPGNSAWS
jgi:hypothetical protein